ncbi:UNVERIFIED_CONTAM: hypothetical protein FKN15_047162 [Acipenser sinensis]
MLPSHASGKGEALASGSYHGNPDYPGPYGTMERPEAPPPGLRCKEPAARMGECWTWSPSAPAPRETVPVEPLYAASKAASAPASAAPAGALKLATSYPPVRTTPSALLVQLHLRLLSAHHHTHRLRTAVPLGTSSLSRDHGHIRERPSPGLGPQTR